MKLTNEVHIERDPAEVFATLLDVERVATCMPGSRLLGKVDDSTYEGEVKVKIGPLGVAYTGTVRFLEVDQEARTA
ncbi:SRPBCC domain-containing protein, partial [Kibdelosporangium lantanae]